MRAILAVSALAALALAGCDVNTGPDKTVKAQCNCAPPPAPPDGMRGSDGGEPPAPPTRVRHQVWHQAHGGGHGHYWRREYAEVSVFTYDYHSDSRTYEIGGAGEGGSGDSSYAGGGASGGDDHARDGGDGHGWVDGYGRAHGGSGASADAPVHHETTGDDDARRKPWRGYDVDCPDNDPHKRR